MESSTRLFLAEDEFEDNNPFATQTFTRPIHEESASTTETSQEPTNEEINESEENAGHLGQEASLSKVKSDESNSMLLRKILPERFSGRKYRITITLKDIEKNKNGNPILKFDATVKNLPRFRQSEYKDIRRTYNEVVKFSKYLVVSNLEVFVPVLPPCITAYPSGGDSETKQLFRRWQTWFNKITDNPILVRDEEFVYFIESDFGYSVINSNKKTSIASGIMRKTLKQLAVPYDPYEELATFRPLIKSYYLLCQKLHKLLEKKCKTEKQLSLGVSELSSKLNCLSDFELVHAGMKNMWEKLSKVTALQSDLMYIQLINDMGILGDEIQITINDFYEIKEALTNRYLIMRELAQAEVQTKAKHQQAAKVKSKSSFDPIKVDEAIRALEYASKTEESLSLQVKRVSEEMMFERKEIIKETDKKVQRTLKYYALSKVEHHRRILKHLENIRLDVRIIDEKGGLSRLNRDNLSHLKHNLHQSQSSAGDSWSSRTFRSLQEEKEDDKYDENKDVQPVDAKNAASLLGIATF